ncbi:MAG: STAS domain-containing protein [Gammaproteobacteria bacterium]
MSVSAINNVMIFEDHGHLVVSIQSPLGDDQWQVLCHRVLAWTRRVTGIVLDLKGLDVLDSFSTLALRDLCKTLHFHGQKTVISSIPLPVYVTMSIRGLRIGEAPVAQDLSEAFNILEHPPPYPPAPPGRLY